MAHATFRAAFPKWAASLIAVNDVDSIRYNNSALERNYFMDTPLPHGTMDGCTVVNFNGNL